MKNALVSVVMPIYNETMDELAESTNSILRQTYDNIELIIVNDNPSRSINNIFLSSIRDSRVKIINNKKNEGIVLSLNKGITLANGEYIARMDADDISHKERIEEQLRYLESNNYDLVGSAINLIDIDGNMIKETVLFPPDPVSVKKAIKYFSPVAHPTWLVKKNVYVKLGGYREIPYCEDYDFLVRAICNSTKIGNINNVLLDHRIRNNSISISNINKQIVMRQFIANKSKCKKVISLTKIRNYIDSNKIDKDANRYKKYDTCFSLFKKGKKWKILSPSILFNKYFYYKIAYKIGYRRYGRK